MTKNDKHHSLFNTIIFSLQIIYRPYDSCFNKNLISDIDDDEEEEEEEDDDDDDGDGVDSNDDECYHGGGGGGGGGDVSIIMSS